MEVLEHEVFSMQSEPSNIGVHVGMGTGDLSDSIFNIHFTTAPAFCVGVGANCDA